jgi:hypothetical protein
MEDQQMIKFLESLDEKYSSHLKNYDELSKKQRGKMWSLFLVIVGVLGTLISFSVPETIATSKRVVKLEIQTYQNTKNIITLSEQAVSKEQFEVMLEAAIIYKGRVESSGNLEKEKKYDEEWNNLMIHLSKREYKINLIGGE